MRACQEIQINRYFDVTVDMWRLEQRANFFENHSVKKADNLMCRIIAQLKTPNFPRTFTSRLKFFYECIHDHHYHANKWILTTKVAEFLNIRKAF